MKCCLAFFIGEFIKPVEIQLYGEAHQNSDLKLATSSNNLPSGVLILCDEKPSSNLFILQVAI